MKNPTFHQVGNTYRRMTPEEAKDKVERGEHFGHPEAAMPSDAERVHEWTMALRFAPEDQKLVKKAGSSDSPMEETVKSGFW